MSPVFAVLPGMQLAKILQEEYVRIEEKDQSESPRIQRNFKRGVPQKCRFIPPPLQKDHIMLYSYYDRYTTTDVVTTGDASTVNIWQAGKEEGN